ncbi:MAG: C-terminal binding protein [Candidatus Methylomirabilota bacterium]
MRFLVIHTDPHHTDFRHERAVLEPIGARLETRNATTEAEVAASCQEADALLVTYAKIGRTALLGMPKLKIVVRTGVGYDVVDLAAATERKVMVCNVPDYCVSDLTEHTMALLLAWWRRIPELDQQVRREGWGRAIRPVYRLEGKTLGIVGMGRMGQALAVRAKGFGLRLVGFDPYVPETVFRSLGVERAELDALCRDADIVSIHSPLTAETRHLIDARRLSLMKQTALVVNTARGGLVKTDDLVAAIREGRIAGAALDVVEEEPLPMEHPIRSLPRVLLTPHAAWYSEDAEPELRRRAAEIVAEGLTGKRPASLVNPEAWG